MTNRPDYDFVANVYDAFWSLLPCEALLSPKFIAIAEALLAFYGWTSDELSWEAAQRIGAN